MLKHQLSLSLNTDKSMGSLQSHGESVMDKHQIKGKVEEAKGKIKEVTGKVIGNKKMELEGKAAQMTGKAEAAVGKLKDKIEKSTAE